MEQLGIQDKLYYKCKSSNVQWYKQAPPVMSYLSKEPPPQPQVSPSVAWFWLLPLSPSCATLSSPLDSLTHDIALIVLTDLTRISRLTYVYPHLLLLANQAEQITISLPAFVRNFFSIPSEEKLTFKRKRTTLNLLSIYTA